MSSITAARASPATADNTGNAVNVASSSNSFESKISEFWNSGDDFAPLEFAGQTVTKFLRDDESSPDADLYRKISATGPGSHSYFAEVPVQSREQIPPMSSATTPRTSGPAIAEFARNVLPTPLDSTGRVAPALTTTPLIVDPVAPPVVSFKHTKSVPLPALLVEKRKDVKIASFMGLLGEAGLAYMTVDSTVYLWSLISSSSSFCAFTVPAGECIVSIGLVRPKPGVFRKDLVKWCLVVTTAKEVLLCALSAKPSSGKRRVSMEHGNTSLRLVPTSYSMSTDNVRMHAIAGTDSGRIFLGGQDGFLYEMVYEGVNTTTTSNSRAPVSVEEKLDLFYDHDEATPEIIISNSDNVVTDVMPSLSKRAWDVISTSISDATSPVVLTTSERPKKCLKINRSSTVIGNVVPEFLSRGLSFLLGKKLSTGGGSITKIVVDEDRECLYSLSSDGYICVFDFSTVNKVPSLRLAARLDAIKTTKSYLEVVQRGQIPSSSNYSSDGLIVFPGGSAAAAANVGDKEGARLILKLEKESNESFTKSGIDKGVSSSILRPTSIHVISPTESSRLTLLAVTAGGIRLYISALSTQVISQGPGSSYGNGSRNNSRRINPVAPYRFMTLCNVRAPPPISVKGYLAVTGDSPVEGGVAPNISINGSTSSALLSPLVDSCAYDKGILIAAVGDYNNQQRQRKSVSDGQRNLGPRMGDIVVASYPDSAKRKIERAPSGVGMSVPGDVAKPDLIPPGGISERVTFPMNTAYGGMTASDAGAVLLGGKVLDIGIINATGNNNALSTLFNCSRTPTDIELSVGLPPRFFPTTRISSALNGSHSEIVSQRADTDMVNGGPTSFKILSTLFTNILLSRPLRTGLSVSNGASPAQYSDRASSLYRISKRDASKGFSTTAEEQVSTATATPISSSIMAAATKSARLRQWLLQPDPMPLNDLSRQYYMPAKEVVMLNAGGLHYFEYETISSKLADSMNNARENVRRDSTINSFFTTYGYVEGCAMCMGLAIGCSDLISSTVLANEDLVSRAIDAALARAFVPKLVLLNTAVNHFGSGITSTVDPLVPTSYEFRPSALSDSMFTLFSRLVRPFWHKPAAVVTEGRTLRIHHTNHIRQTPAKVELLLDETTMKTISMPLRALLDKMKNIFRRAVKAAPGLSRQDSISMDLDNNENMNDSQVTRYLQYQNQVQNQFRNAGMNQYLSDAEAETTARLIEEKNIHCLYRLLARTVQLLDLITLLRLAHSISDIPEVDWGQLHGLTFRQLIQTSEGQDRLESLLNRVVTVYASSRSIVPYPSTQADELANMFASQCYLYFSPGSRFAYLGLRRAEEAIRCPPASSTRLSLANQAADYFRQAAKHWHSAPLITGRILHRKGKESHYQISLRAMESESPLAMAVHALLQLDDVSSIVDICLMTASNFKDFNSFDGLLVDSYNGSIKYDLPWEKNLYHKRRVSSHKSNSLSRPSASASPSSVISYGTDVTAHDAVDTCYALIFQCLSTLLDAKSILTDRMVAACAADSNESFLNDFFEFMIDNDYADTLLRINSPQLNEWLQARKDSDLLSRYYNVQGRHREAGQVAMNQGCDPNLQTPLEQRIYYISMSLISYKKALEDTQRRRYESVSTELMQKVTEIEETLQIARFQNRIRQLVESDQNLKSRLSDDSLFSLQYTLIDVTTLYNDYAAKLDLYDECLKILHACRQDDPGSIQKIWMMIFSDELLPCTTRNEQTYEKLQDFFDNQFNDSILFTPPNVDIGTMSLFDDGRWEAAITSRIKSLGKDLYRPGADFVFPVAFLMNKLQSLRDSIPSILPPSWSLKIFADVGVPFMDIINTFDDMISREGNIISQAADHQRYLSHMNAVLELIQDWISSARFDNAFAKKQLFDAVANGRLLSKINTIKSQCIMIPNTGTMIDVLRNFEEDIRMIN